MKIIPAIDILNGEVVRLSEGDYNRVETYDIAINEMIEKYAAHGIDMIHIVDLNGAKGDYSNQLLIAELINGLSVKVQLGGGVRSVNKARELISEGISRVIVGTAAIVEEDFLYDLATQVSTKEVILGIDVLDKKLKVNGWQTEALINLSDYISKALDLGYRNFLCTDISKDGLLQGPSTWLYKELIMTFPAMNLIASGGVKDMEDIKKLLDVGVAEVVVGKAIYEGHLSLEEIKLWNSKQSSNVS